MQLLSGGGGRCDGSTSPLSSSSLAAVLIFVLQNTDTVRMSFLGLALSAPLALIVLVAYVLGAATGGSLYALLRRSIQGSRRVAR